MRDFRLIVLVVGLIVLSYSPMINSLTSIESKFLEYLHQNINDSSSLNHFYRRILQEIRHHRIIDTVTSPINISKILLHDYNEEYLKYSCFETISDLLHAHGHEKNDPSLPSTDLQSLLPAILYTVDNPGCARQSPPSTPHSFFNIWILGILLLFLIKSIHCIVFVITGDDCLFRHSTKDNSPLIKYRLWLGLGLNAFTCGLMLGTIIYHLIPHIYDVPNENFDYVYLLRATIIFFGVYLFFIVEKLLRFRFKIDDDKHNEDDHLRESSDTSMMQMARMHATIHINDELQDDSDDEQMDFQLKNPTRSDHSTMTNTNRKKNLICYHLIHDFSNDFIYGWALATAFAHDRLIGSILSLLIFTEGFRRHSQTSLSLGRKLAFIFLLLSLLFLLIGYILGGILAEMNWKFTHQAFSYIRMEYIYSIIYGALFYTALVTLIPELNHFGHDLQIVLKEINQTNKQRRLIKILILLCQNLFLLLGVILTLVLASMWRYYHRIDIFDYVCKRDPSRIFCHH